MWCLFVCAPLQLPLGLVMPKMLAGAASGAPTRTSMHLRHERLFGFYTLPAGPPARPRRRLCNAKGMAGDGAEVVQPQPYVKVQFVVQGGVGECLGCEWRLSMCVGVGLGGVVQCGCACPGMGSVRAQ